MVNCKAKTRKSEYKEDCSNEALLEGFCMGHYWKTKEDELKTDEYMKLRYGSKEDGGMIC